MFDVAVVCTWSSSDVLIIRKVFDLSELTAASVSVVSGPSDIPMSRRFDRRLHGDQSRLPVCLHSSFLLFLSFLLFQSSVNFFRSILLCDFVQAVSDFSPSE